MIAMPTGSYLTGILTATSGKSQWSGALSFAYSFAVVSKLTTIIKVKLEVVVPEVSIFN